MKRIFTIGLVVLGVSTAIARADDPVSLRMNEAAGQTWKFDSTQTTDTKNQGTMNGQTQSVATKSNQHRSGTVQVLVAVNGVPSSMRVTFDKSCSTTNEQNGQSQTMPEPYAGATITLTRAPDGMVTDDFKGQGDADSAADVRSFIDQDAVIMPDHPVQVGDEWSGQPAIVARVLQLTGQDTGGMTLKLLSVKTIDGHPTADIKVSFAMNKVSPQMKAQVVSQGTELVDLTTGHAIKNNFSGSADISGQQQGPGPDGKPATVDIQGHGTLTMAQTSPLTDGSTVAATPAAAPTDTAVAGANPLGTTAAPTFDGTFSDGKLKVQLQPSGDGFVGTFSMSDHNFPVAASMKDATLTGAFAANGATFPFTATLDGDSITLVTGTATYHLTKAGAANPLGVSP